MAEVMSPCGRKMNMTEFTRHIPKCGICTRWWIQRGKK